MVLRREVTRDMLEQQYPVGLLLSYRPETAQTDPITKEVCLRIDPEVSQTTTRLTADTLRGRELLTDAFKTLGEDCDARALCTWVRQDGHGRAGGLPVEIELEITTDDPLPKTTLRPRGKRVPARRLDDLDAISRLAEQLAAYDDRLIVLGGHGDPLLHPEFPEICRRIRAAGVCGLAVVTTLVELPETTLNALLAHGVDLIEVQLDANSAATYQAVHDVDALGRVIENVERLLAARRSRQNPEPVVACSLTRCAATLGELEAFFDQWIRAAGWAIIRGYNDYAGLLPADSVMPMRPPLRGPCRRLDTRMMLLADGRAVLCSQDVTGETELGSWASQQLTELWNGGPLGAARQAHACLKLVDLTLCSRCGEWSRL
jgi:hypothetical protein